MNTHWGFIHKYKHLDDPGAAHPGCLPDRLLRRLARHNSYYFYS